MGTEIQTAYTKLLLVSFSSGCEKSCIRGMRNRWSNINNRCRYQSEITKLAASKNKANFQNPHSHTNPIIIMLIVSRVTLWIFGMKQVISAD